MAGEIRIEKLWDPTEAGVDIEAEGDTDPGDDVRNEIRPGFSKPYFYRFTNGTTEDGDWLYRVFKDYIYYGAYRDGKLVGFMMTLAKHTQKPTDNVSMLFVDDAPTYDALLKRYTKETGDKQNMKLLRYDVSRPVPGTFESLPEYEREPPGFNRVEPAEGQPIGYVPAVDLGERFAESGAPSPPPERERLKPSTPMGQSAFFPKIRVTAGRRRAQTRRRKRQRRPVRRNRTTRRT